MSFLTSSLLLLNFSVHNAYYFSKDQIENFKIKLAYYSQNYVDESIKRGLYYRNPLDEVHFAMDYHKRYISYGEGFCHYVSNTIYFSENFTESTFFHELGHCLHEYAHSYRKEKHLMSWYLSEEEFQSKRKELLDDYYFSYQPKVNTLEGDLAHKKMLNSYGTP